MEDHLEKLARLIREVKPSLGDVPIKSADMLTETLGLDSLDITQLARSIRRNLFRDFDLEQWLEEARTHRLSVASILEYIDEKAIG